MSQYEVFDPFKLHKNGPLVNRRMCARFWQSVEQGEPGLAKAVGCYVFGIRAGRGAKPWYVGKTEMRSFKGECLTPDKLNKYNEALNGRRSGTAIPYTYSQSVPDAVNSRSHVRRESGTFARWRTC